MNCARVALSLASRKMSGGFFQKAQVELLFEADRHASGLHQLKRAVAILREH
jgi:hypothetical protein